MNLIPRPPTNDFQASARVSAGNFGELRADTRLSGPLKRDRVMGSFAFERGVRDGFVRDLKHPDRPLGGDDVTAARGQLRVVFDRRTNLLLSSDVDRQKGIPLTYNKVLVAKPGFQFDNPSDFHDVRTSLLAWNDTLHYGASARLTMALTPATTGQPDRVSKPGLRVRRGFRQHRTRRGADAPARTTTPAVPGGHALAPAARGDLGRWPVSLQRIRSPDDLVRSARRAIQRRLDPRIRHQPRGVRTGHLWTDVAGLGDRWRSLHPRRKGHRQCGGRYASRIRICRFPVRSTAIPIPLPTAPGRPDRPEMQLSNGGLAYVSATRGFKSGGFNISSTTPGRGTILSGRGARKGVEGARCWAGVPRFNTWAFCNGLHTNLQVRRHRHRGARHRQCRSATFAASKSKGRHWSASALHAGGGRPPVWLDSPDDRYMAVALDGTTGGVSGNRLNNAPERPDACGFPCGLGDIGNSSLMFPLSARSTAQSTVFNTPFNDNIQRQSPYGLLGAPRRIWTPQSPLSLVVE